MFPETIVPGERQLHQSLLDSSSHLRSLLHITPEQSSSAVDHYNTLADHVHASIPNPRAELPSRVSALTSRVSQTGSQHISAYPSLSSHLPTTPIITAPPSQPYVVCTKDQPSGSFAEVIRGTHSRNAAADFQPLSPVKKGDYYSVAVDDELYHQRIKACEASLIGRLILAKGDKPWRMVDLQQRLQDIWRPQHPWRMISLGKGYYNFQFDSVSDRARVWDRGSWIVKPGTLRLQQWSPDFNPYKLKTSVAQLWIRIYELSLEYWHPSIILGVAKAAGNPITLRWTRNRSLGFSVIMSGFLSKSISPTQFRNR